MTEERWEGILACKKNFLLEEGYDPRTSVFMNQEVAASWVRSRQQKINPNDSVTRRQLGQEEYQKILEKNSLLIRIAEPLIKSFKEMAILPSGYVLYLCDKDGVFLHQEGRMMRIATEGLVWSEENAGTNAHILCIRSKQPFQLMGPEHYMTALENLLASAAPIMDETGDVIAALILSQPLFNRPWETDYQNSRSHTLGLITALAAAVEAQIKLYKSNEKLKESFEHLKVVNDNLRTANDTLSATVFFVDEGIITVDRDGKILNINQEGIRILKFKSGELGETESRNISEFVSSQSRIMSSVNKGKNVDIEEIIFVGSDEQPYVINIRPVVNPESKEVDVAVLRLNHVEKINALVASKSGGIARYTFDTIMGESEVFKRTITLAKRFAKSPENILLIGESGTGKELFAQAIHNIYSPQGPFMAVNCAAMPRELIESELFGYEGGSFTGAERAGRPGKIELAHGGTLFLDEIGDMPLELQAVLLRTLEDKQVMRVGGNRYKKVDFRLIAATNKNLLNMVRENQFREDLYFRISVLAIDIPPLRERDDDVALLSKFFVESYCSKMGWNIAEIASLAQSRINSYEWPGNVRQLQNAMIYAVNTALDDVIKPENLPREILMDTSPLKVKKIQGGNLSDILSLERLERDAIEEAMIFANNYIPAAAGILGISRSTLYRKINGMK